MIWWVNRLTRVTLLYAAYVPKLRNDIQYTPTYWSIGLHLLWFKDPAVDCFAQVTKLW